MTDYSQRFYFKACYFTAESYSPNFSLDCVKKKQRKNMQALYFINHNLILLKKSLFYIDVSWESTEYCAEQL